MIKLEMLGLYEDGYYFEETHRVYSWGGCYPSITTKTSNGHGSKILTKENDMEKYRIRKLTEGECYRLMGFEQKDTDACREIGESRSQIAHQAGDSIVTTVLMGIFGELLDVDYQTAIDDYTEKLREEVK